MGIATSPTGAMMSAELMMSLRRLRVTVALRRGHGDFASPQKKMRQSPTFSGSQGNATIVMTS
jgi:hypothetical protein